ncbi:MAG: adenosine kinase [Micavibrio sp.]|nr:adenosine kinase [Micavibrio sp.]
MDTTKFDVLGVGNAIVDVLAKASDSFIEEQRSFGMEKGGMTLIDADRAEDLYDLMNPSTEMSGGSAANTLACLASMGGKGAFIGKVADDQLGNIFRHDMKAQGIEFNTSALTGSKPTARCLVLITPDAERTMNTFLGACTELTSDDVEEDQVREAKVTYLEGYLFDPAHAKQAFYKTAAITKAAGRQLALSLSDPFCVERHREDFKDLIFNHVDILFANEDELCALMETDFETACDLIANKCEVAAITRGAKGSMVIKDGERTEIDSVKPEELVDTTGAGDAYAAGFLYGYANGKDMAVCGRYGSIAAAEVISHIGPRPSKSLADLIKGV